MCKPRNENVPVTAKGCPQHYKSITKESYKRPKYEPSPWDLIPYP